MVVVVVVGAEVVVEQAMEQEEPEGVDMVVAGVLVGALEEHMAPVGMVVEVEAVQVVELAMVPEENMGAAMEEAAGVVEVAVMVATSRESYHSLSHSPKRRNHLT